MTKMIKMSLIAAVAVTGMTSVASASSLEEAVKNTEIKGYVRYRLNNDHETTKEGDTTEEAKLSMVLTSKVNDMVKSNLKFVGEAKTASAETQATMNLKEANFVVNAAGATVIAGLQTSQSPFFTNNGDTRSHGITALVPAGPVTVAGAYYYTTVLSSDSKTANVPINPAAQALANSVTAVGVLGNFGGVKANLWYASVEDGTDVEDQALTGFGLKDASAMSVQLIADVAGINVDAMHQTLETSNIEGSLTKIVASGKFANLDVAAAYAMTGDEALGGQVTLDSDTDGSADLAMEILNMQATTDASAFYASVGTKLTDTVSASVAILSGSEDKKGNDKSFNETDLTVKYQMSKNFGIKAWYATGEYNAGDFANSRIEVLYKF